MKRKIIGYSLSFLFVMGVLFSFIQKYQGFIPPHQPISIENEEIIAPAITDAFNDMTRVPILQSGLVKKIHVRVGQVVKKGEPLLSLDDTSATQNVNVSQISLIQAKNSVIIQRKNLKHIHTQLKRLKSIDPRAISRSELREKTHEFKMANIQLEQLKHNLDIAKANLENATFALKQYTIVAPKNGIVLQMNAHVNEYVGTLQPIIFLGDAKKIIVRISIDERDIKHFSPQASVYLTNNDNEQLKIPLRFIQLDRFIIMQERLNSRVQEALYFFNRNDYPNLAAGQQFDAHIAVKTNGLQ